MTSLQVYYRRILIGNLIIRDSKSEIRTFERCAVIDRTYTADSKGFIYTTEAGRSGAPMMRVDCVRK